MMVERTSKQRGMTLLEVNVAIMIMAISVIPLLVSLGDARRKVTDGQVKRTMKQLLEYKLAFILLDKPAEGEEPLYVDGWEGNFGEEFDNDPEKAYWFDEKYYYYSYRVDSEEVDLGMSGGITGEEFGEDPLEEPSTESADAAGSPFGTGEEEEDLGQLRYRVTLFVSYQPGNALFDRHMSAVTYVRHPEFPETMQGPDLGAGGGGIGGGEASAGGGGAAGSTTAPIPGAAGSTGDKAK